MATKQESYDHGVHNEACCKLLALNGEFPDWTITTAFYSCLHFLTSKVFPFMHSVKGQPDIKFETIEEWQKFKSYSANKRHALLTELVYRFCDNRIAGEYDWLLSTSWNARYHHYRHDKAIVDKCISVMGIIKKYCDPKTSAKKITP